MMKAPIEDAVPVVEVTLTGQDEDQQVVFPYPVASPDDLLVLLDGEPVAAEVTVADDNRSATVDFGAPVSGTVRIERRTVPYMDWRPMGNTFPLERLEDQLARLTMAAQEVMAGTIGLPAHTRSLTTLHSVIHIDADATIGERHGHVRAEGNGVILQVLDLEATSDMTVTIGDVPVGWYAFGTVRGDGRVTLKSATGENFYLQGQGSSAEAVLNPRGGRHLFHLLYAHGGIFVASTATDVPIDLTGIALGVDSITAQKATVGSLVATTGSMVSELITPYEPTFELRPENSMGVVMAYTGYAVNELLVRRDLIAQDTACQWWVINMGSRPLPIRARGPSGDDPGSFEVPPVGSGGEKSGVHIIAHPGEVLIRSISPVAIT